MLNISHFRNFIVRPVLKHLEMWSEVAENLVVGTAIQESHITHLKQHNNGPALGLFQMEPATHDDIWKNFINRRQTLATKVKQLMLSGTSLSSINIPPATEMIGNLYYATAMCRIHYWRVPHPLPQNNIQDVAKYWKTWYNTNQGAGTVNEFVANYTKFNRM